MRKQRFRKDSGIYEISKEGFHFGGDEEEEDPEEYLVRWKEGVTTVLEQESVRMFALTEYFKRKIRVFSGSEEEVLNEWKYEIKGIMSLTQDLIECVSNDVIESMDKSHWTRSTSSSSSSGEDLGDIVEEEEEEGREIDRYFILRHSPMDPKIKKRSSSDVKKMLRSLFKSSRNRDFKWDAVALNVSRMKKNEYFHQWFNDRLKAKQIASKEGTKRVASFSKEFESEDIFKDWIERCKPFDDDDIVRAFWNISLDSKRTRKMSEEILDLPIGDQPDIIHDRCEILEGRITTSKFNSTPPAYWNVFKTWKRIFRQKNKPPILHRTCRTLKEEPEDPEEYFRDWRRNFDENVFDNAKTLKPSMNIAEKLSLAFADYECNIKRIKEENRLFDDLPYLKEEFKESHEEFCRLRGQIRFQRQRHRSFGSVMSEEDWLKEWNWNFNEDQFGLGDDSVSYFQDWLPNLKQEEPNERNSVVRNNKKKVLFKNRNLFSSNHCNDNFNIYKQVCSHLQIEKAQKRKMNRIFAKQPCQRIYCH